MLQDGSVSSTRKTFRKTPMTIIAVRALSAPTEWAYGVVVHGCSAQCFYVGDAPSDGRAARAAGMRAVGVSWGSHSGKEWRENFDVVADTLPQLRAALLMPTTPPQVARSPKSLHRHLSLRPVYSKQTTTVENPPLTGQEGACRSQLRSA